MGRIIVLAEIEKFKLTVTMNATITVFDDAGQPKDWLRQGSETRATWNGMPTVEELLLRYKDMTEITSATLGDVLGSSQAHLNDARRG